MVAVLAVAGLSQVAWAKDKGANAADKPLKGQIVSVTPEKDKPDTLDIVVSTGGKKNAQQVTVTAGIKVTVDGQDDKAANLKAGEKVVTPATGTALKIEASTGENGGKPKKAK